MRAPRADVVVAGAGPVGCVAALALAARGVGCVLLEAGGAAGRSAFRPIALSHASRLILERLDAWHGLVPTPIESILVSQAGAFGRTHLRAGEAGVAALGYVVGYAELAAALGERLAGKGVRVEQTGSAAARELLERARCVVHAEGRAEEARERRYRQDAVVARIETDPPASTTAFERFTSEGPLALLPMAGHYALVWSTRPERAARLAAAPAEEFLAALAACAGARLGRPRAVSDRSLQPLALRVRASRVGARAIYIGNAAQTLHPVAGQGLNLGLRDAWELAGALADAADPGAPHVLERYAALRRCDAAATIGATRLLAGTFLGTEPLAAALRGAAMSALDVLPPARRFFARRMIFGPSAIP